MLATLPLLLSDKQQNVENFVKRILKVKANLTAIKVFLIKIKLYLIVTLLTSLQVNIETGQTYKTILGKVAAAWGEVQLPKL